MTELWEAMFASRQMMWGSEPSRSALFARDYFASMGAKDILIPGIGYGRNARPFLEHGMSVTGIEISATATALARTQLGLDITIHHGSVTDMPYDTHQYEVHPGVEMFFYDAGSIQREFGPHGELELSEIDAALTRPRLTCVPAPSGRWSGSSWSFRTGSGCGTRPSGCRR